MSYPSANRPRHARVKSRFPRWLQFFFVILIFTHIIGTIFVIKMVEPNDCNCGGGSVVPAQQQLAIPIKEKKNITNTTLEIEFNSGGEDDDIASACLIVMDDNHFLIEWIAYHYHVLKLRHLIISSDPKSRTSPQKIIDRWKGLMTIELWNTHDYFDSNSEENDRRYREPWESDSLSEHRDHQAAFNRQCLRHLKVLDRGWVIMVDTDEFVLINPDLYKNERFRNFNTSISRPGSIFTFLNQYIMISTQDEQTACVNMHRRQITAKESPLSEQREKGMPKFINSSNFLTTRFLYPQDQEYKFFIPEDLQDEDNYCHKGRIIPGKVLIDLKRLRTVDLTHPEFAGMPHMPIETICTETFPDKLDVFLFVNHYLPSWEQWNFRLGDSRGSQQRAGKYAINNMSPTKHKSTEVWPWLEGFVSDIGEGNAARLLAGAGQLEAHPDQQIREEVLPPKPIFRRVETMMKNQLYQVGDWVEAEYTEIKIYNDTKVYETKWFPALICAFLDDNHYTVLYNDCHREPAVALDKIRNITHKNGDKYKET